MSRPRFSVEVFGDSEARNPGIDVAVTALEELQQVVGPMEIIARNGLLRLGSKNRKKLNIDRIPPVVFQADFGLVMTDRPFVEYTEPKIMDDGLDTVGIAFPRGIASPFAIVNTEIAPNAKGTTKHEVLHLLDLLHCDTEKCLMHAISSAGRNEDPCDSCFQQMERNIFDRSGDIVLV